MTLAALPRSVEGFAEVKVLVVDDGSTDRTAEVALSCGADRVVSLPCHCGLGRTFMAGIHASLEMSADVIVNIDADYQYLPSGIPDLVAPIVTRGQRVVIGQRPLRRMLCFSRVKRLLHAAGNLFVSLLLGVSVLDATSGFRAVDARTAREISIQSRFSYTIEMLYYLVTHRVPFCFVAIEVSGVLMRPSRLMRHLPHYLARTAGIMLQCELRYRPYLSFAALVTVISACALLMMTAFGTGGRELLYGGVAPAIALIVTHRMRMGRPGPVESVDSAFPVEAPDERENI